MDEMHQNAVEDANCKRMHGIKWEVNASERVRNIHKEDAKIYGLVGVVYS